MDREFVNPHKKPEENEIENSLRPKRIEDFVGQKKLKENLFYAVESAKKRVGYIDHILLYGPPGLGKTTLAELVANEMEVGFRSSSGPAIVKPGDIVGLLTNLKKGDVLFLDEIHRLNKVTEEYLYPAMEDYKIDFMVDTGANAKSIQLNLEKFTLVGATTMAGSISKPMRDRFGIILRLEYYSDKELTTIIKRSSQILNISIDDDAAYELGKRSRGTPRIANRLLKRSRDVAVVNKKNIIDTESVEKTLSLLGIDKNGLDELDRKILEITITHYCGGPVGVKSVAMVLGEESDTIEEMYEPFLVQQGYLKRTPRGRVVTAKAYELLGIEQKNKQSNEDASLF